MVFLLMYFSFGFWNTAQPDGWGGFLLVGVILLLVDPPRKGTISMAIAGVLVATATLLKPTFAAYLAIPIAFPCTHASNNNDRIRGVVACISAFCITAATPMLLIAIRSGGWDDMLDIAHSWVSHASNRISVTFVGSPYFWPYAMPALLAGVGTLILYIRKARRLAGIVALWEAIGLAVPVIQGKYFGYHFIPFLISAIVPIAVTIEAATSLTRRWVLIALCVTVLGPLAMCCLSRKDSSASYERPQAALAAYIVAHSSPRDGILVAAGELIPVYALSQRLPPTRFPYTYPLVAESPLRAKFQNVFMREITHHPPFYVLLDASYGSWFFAGFPAFDDFLHSNYAVVNRMGTDEIWQLKRTGGMKEPLQSLAEDRNFNWGPWAR